MTLVISKGITLAKANNGIVDPDAIIYINNVEKADGENLEYDTAKAIHDFVVGCKADGIWNAIKASCILAGARTLAGALVPLVGAAPTNVGGLFVSDDYNRKTGLVGDGSTKYLDSNRNNNADPQDSVSHAVWISTAGTGGHVPIGAGFNLTGSTRCSQNTDGPATTIRIRTAGTMGAIPVVISNNNSFFGYRRSASNAALLRMNAVEYARTEASETPFSGNVFVFADNNAGAATAHMNGRMAFYSIGESLNLAVLDARVTDLINAFAAAIP
jgi:hypothetical protein